MEQPAKQSWKVFDAYGPMDDGKLRVSRIGAFAENGFQGLSVESGHDISATEKDLVFLITAVNSYDAALALALAVLAEDERSVYMDGPCEDTVELARKFLELIKRERIK